MTNNAAAGARFERKVRDHLTADGYVVIKSGGSLGIADLVALKIGQTLLVQCKGGNKPITHEGWNDLFSLALAVGAAPLVADRPKRGVIRYRLVTGAHTRNRKLWPCEGWHPDAVEVAIAMEERAGR